MKVLMQAMAAALVLAVCTSTSVAAPGFETTGDVAAASDETRYQDMETAFEAGDIEQALQRVNEDLAVVSFAMGMTALESGDTDGALLSFERTLSLSPGHDRARVELARTYVDNGELERARQEFETVLGHNPPAPVKRNIEVFLDRIRRWDQRWDFGVQAAGGVFHDDNVNVGPNSDRIRVQPIRAFGAEVNTLLVNEESQPQDTWGAFFYTAARARYDGGERGDWAAAGGAEYYQTWLQDSQDYEIRYYSLNLGPRHAGPKHFLDLPFRYEHIDQGDRDLIDVIGLLPVYRRIVTPSLHRTTGLRLQYRDYSELDERDSYYLELAESVKQFLGEGRLAVSLGALVFYDGAEEDIYTNYGLEVSLGGEVDLGWDTACYVRGRYRGEWYDEREPLAPERRQDNEFQAMTGLHKVLGPHVSADVSYQYTLNLSTFEIYEYDRNIFTLGLNGDF